MLLATFEDPQGETHDFYLFDKPIFTVILPLTDAGEVITIRQYYQGCDKILRTLPGGNINANEPPAETIRRELMEETGYLCPEIIQLGSKVWPDPGNILSYYYCFLGIGAQKIRKQNLDDTEDIEFGLISLQEWLILTEKEIEDPCAMVATHRALPYLRERGLL